MPVIDVSYNDLQKLIGRKILLDELREHILYAKGEIEGIEEHPNDKKDKILKIEIKDTNRPDLWSTEGIARELAGRLKKDGLPRCKVKKSRIKIIVDKKVGKIRPLIVCAAVRGLKINDDVLSQLIQLQEKVSITFGRNRKEVAIGVYDLKRAKPPIRYTAVKPDSIKFRPLGFDKALTPREILKTHPKGKEYGHLLADFKEYPLLIDSKKNVLSMPPIINSDYTGKIGKDTKDIFVECTGYDFRFLLPALNVMVMSLVERGAKIESVQINYPGKKMVLPDLKPKKASVSIEGVNKITGLNLTKKEICSLLEKGRYKTKIKGNRIGVLYPAYRQDIMHERDIIEDVIISYGYNKIEPKLSELATIGKASPIEMFSNNIAEIMIGCGFQEILSYTLTNKGNLFDKMNLVERRIVEIKNPVSKNWCVFRTWLLPSLVEFLARNKHVEYPQNVFEIGDCIAIDEKQETKTRDVRKLAAVMTDNSVTYEEISSLLDALMRNLGLKYELKSVDHQSFIPGRVADIMVNKKSIGTVGEIHPLVLNNWKLEKPVVGFELDVNEIFEIVK